MLRKSKINTHGGAPTPVATPRLDEIRARDVELDDIAARLAAASAPKRRLSQRAFVAAKFREAVDALPRSTKVTPKVAYRIVGSDAGRPFVVSGETSHPDINQRRGVDATWTDLTAATAALDRLLRQNTGKTFRAWVETMPLTAGLRDETARWTRVGVDEEASA